MSQVINVFREPTAKRMMDGRLTSKRTCAIYRLGVGRVDRVSWESWLLPFLTKLEGKWQYQPQVTRCSNAPVRQRPSGREEREERRFKRLATPTCFLRHPYRGPADMWYDWSLKKKTLFYYLHFTSVAELIRNGCEMMWDVKVLGILLNFLLIDYKYLNTENSKQEWKSSKDSFIY